jgi:hypothetical protein
MGLSMSTPCKKWWKSKTLWFNVAIAVGTAVEASLHVLQAQYEPTFYLTLVAITSAGNIVLRTISSEEITK